MEIPKDVIQRFKKTEDSGNTSGILNANFTSLGSVGASLDRKVEKERNQLKAQGTVMQGESPRPEKRVFKDDHTLILRDRIIARMEFEPHKEYSPQSLAEQLHVEVSSNMHASLATLVDMNLIKRVGHARYMLVGHVNKEAIAATTATTTTEPWPDATGELVIPHAPEKPAPVAPPLISNNPVPVPGPNVTVGACPDEEESPPTVDECLRNLKAAHADADYWTECLKVAIEVESKEESTAADQLRQLKSLLGAIK